MRTLSHASVLALLLLGGAGCAGEEDFPAESANVVGRIQGTEFQVPTPAAAVWLLSEAEGLAALRLSDRTDGCGAPAGWSLLVQVNLADEHEYALGSTSAEPGKGYLREYRRDDGSLDMPEKADGRLALTYAADDRVAGSLQLTTDGGADLAAVFEAPVCPATALVTP